MNLEENKIFYYYIEYKPTFSERILFDVGAHKGGSVKPFLEKSWIAYAFEPNNENRKSLETLKQRFNNLNIDSRAVSNEVKSNIPFYTSEVSTGISGLSKFHNSHIESAKVDTVTIEKFCKEKQIEKIDYLKIDTEGFDLFVLQGVPWDTTQPEVILCEFEDRKTKQLGYSFYDMADYLVDKGYQLIISEWYPIIEYGRQHSWNCFKEYPCKLDTEDAWGNIIAFKGNVDYIKFTNAVTKTFEKNELCTSEAKLNSVYNSTSWKITRPLRSLSNLKKKLLTQRS